MDIIHVLPPWFAALMVSLTTCLLLIATFTWHARFTGDINGLGTQNRHGAAVPRVGGMALALGVAAAAPLLPTADAQILVRVLPACLPALLAGLAEDMTRRVSPGCRLFATLASAALAMECSGARLMPFGVPGIDDLLTGPVVGVTLTLLTIAGAANAINIVDGVNGLASGCLLFMCCVLVLVAWHVGDGPLMSAAALLGAALVGFFVWNFPQGRIFLGDGGAYFGGTAVAVLALLLVVRNPSVAPLFPWAVLAYPLTETAYSIWRRASRRGRSPFAADRLHLHSLVQARLLRCSPVRDGGRRRLLRNSRTAPYLWTVCLCGVLPAATGWSSGLAQGVSLVATLLAYGALYRVVVRGHAPAWLRQERTPTPQAVEPRSALGSRS